MSRYVYFSELGGPEVLKIGEREIPSPGPREILVETRSIGVQFSDGMWRRGQYLEAPNLPSGIGTEACGIVAGVGDAVTNLAVGDRVATFASFSVNKYPVSAEHFLVPADCVRKVPPGLSDVEGAALFGSYLPVLLMLDEIGGLAGKTVLLTAATSNIALAGAQVARASGARVIGLTRATSAYGDLLAAEFDLVVSTSEADFRTKILDFTNGNGVELILDSVGGSGAQLLYGCAGKLAHVVHYGVLGGTEIAVPLFPLIGNRITVRGFTTYGYTGSRHLGYSRKDDKLDSAFAEIERNVGLGAYRPTISGVFKLSEIHKAHAALEGRRSPGKIVVVP